jgi:PhoH-like ATPase
MTKYIVLDTNIILIDANNLLTIAKENPSSTVIVPDVVIDEIDSKKSTVGEIGYQARSFGRIMAKGTIKLVNVIDEKLTTTVYILDDGIEVMITSFNSYSEVNEAHSSIANDRKIIYTALKFGATLISNDVMCRIRAQASGISAIDLKQVEDLDVEFTKHLTVSPELFGSLHNTPILEVDPDYLPHNFSYLFTCSATGSTKLGVVDSIITIIGKDSEKDLRNQLVPPKNAHQLILAYHILDRSTDITLCEAIAGSGKTLCALSNAMKLVDQGYYSSIIYMRNSVDDYGMPDEEMGFMKGSEEEKSSHYLHPFFDTVTTIAKHEIGKREAWGVDYDKRVEAHASKLIESYNMKAMTAFGLRGRTFDSSIIIIDEAQNISKPTMLKILSRIGKNSKVIILGSLKQIDSKYLTKYNSGLSVLLDSTRKPNPYIKLNAVTLQKVLRGPITEFAEILFSKGANND